VTFTLDLGDRGELFVDGRLPVLVFDGDAFVKLNDQTGVALGMLRLDYDEAADTLVF